MTPPPAATHAGRASIVFAPTQDANNLAVTTIARLLDGRAWARLRLLIDALVLCAASSAALFAAPTPQTGVSRVLSAAFPVVVLAVLYARQSPDRRLYGSMLDTAAHVLGIVSLAAVLTVAAASSFGAVHPVGLAIRLWLFATVYLGVARIVLLVVRRQAVRRDAFATPTLILGAGLVGDHLVRRLTSDRRYGMRPVGFLDADPLPRAGRLRASSLPVLGGPDDLAEAVARTGARRLIIAFSSEPDHTLVDRVRECERLGIEVSLVPRLYESISVRATLDHLGGLPLVGLKPIDPKGWQFAVKHCLGWVFAALTLCALAPLLLAIVLAVRIGSPGPALFRQRRVGRDGHEFDLLKFRSMRVAPGPEEFELGEDSAPGGVEGEDRRTRIGRWLRASSLDELPQLINVLRGDMTLVGPRPERPEFAERFATAVDHYDDRHRVKSGITGWAQVNGLRGQTSIADRVEWDNHYIQNWSLRLDLRIVALTVAEVLRFRG